MVAKRFSNLCTRSRLGGRLVLVDVDLVGDLAAFILFERITLRIVVFLGVSY